MNKLTKKEATRISRPGSKNCIQTKARSTNRQICAAQHKMAREPWTRRNIIANCLCAFVKWRSLYFCFFLAFFLNWVSSQCVAIVTMAKCKNDECTCTIRANRFCLCVCKPQVVSSLCPYEWTSSYECHQDFECELTHDGCINSGFTGANTHSTERHNNRKYIQSRSVSMSWSLCSLKHSTQIYGLCACVRWM